MVKGEGLFLVKGEGLLLVKGSGLRVASGSGLRVEGDGLPLPCHFLYCFLSYGMILGERELLVKGELWFRVNFGSGRTLVQSEGFKKFKGSRSSRPS